MRWVPLFLFLFCLSFALAQGGVSIGVGIGSLAVQATPTPEPKATSSRSLGIDEWRIFHTSKEGEDSISRLSECLAIEDLAADQVRKHGVVCALPPHDSLASLHASVCKEQKRELSFRRLKREEIAFRCFDEDQKPFDCDRRPKPDRDAFENLVPDWRQHCARVGARKAAVETVRTANKACHLRASRGLAEATYKELASVAPPLSHNPPHQEIILEGEFCTEEATREKKIETCEVELKNEDPEMVKRVCSSPLDEEMSRCNAIGTTLSTLLPKKKTFSQSSYRVAVAIEENKELASTKTQAESTNSAEEAAQRGESEEEENAL